VDSDGLIEAVNPQGEMFGEARLEAALGATSVTHPFADICAALGEFRAGQPQHDDITLIEIECPAPPAVRTVVTPASGDGVTFSIEFGAERLRQDDAQSQLMRLL